MSFECGYRLQFDLERNARNLCPGRVRLRKACDNDRLGGYLPLSKTEFEIEGRLGNESEEGEAKSLTPWEASRFALHISAVTQF
jgi:hypothetical protein